MTLLSKLVEAVHPLVVAQSGIMNAEITALTADSRNVKPYTLFAALQGAKYNGAEYVADAVSKGAAAIVSEQAPGAEVPWIQVKNARRALALMAAAFYQKQPAHIAAVTGTDGKTSTADFFRQFAALDGKKSAAIGTVGVTGDESYKAFPAINTTPDPVLLHHILSTLAAGHCEYVCLEASSHGLDQFRLDGVKLSAAAFTNLTRDHLDYHGTMEIYFAAKQRLFLEVLPASGTAVINADQPEMYETMATLCNRRGQRVLSYGGHGRDLKLLKRIPTAMGQDIELEILGKHHALHLPLIGNFQVMNILAAMGLYIGAGGDVEKAVSHMTALKGVPGRVQHVATHPNGAAVYVDYAHTPGALENLLITLHPHVKNKLHVVFGCGGDRDAGKRQPMGTVGGKLADFAIVTDDNPRSEDPASIRRTVMSGCPSATEIAGRKKAIFEAVRRLHPGDLLVIAGKGHEKTQIIGTDILPFDDAQIAREAVQCVREAI